MLVVMIPVFNTLTFKVTWTQFYHLMVSQFKNARFLNQNNPRKGVNPKNNQVGSVAAFPVSDSRAVSVANHLGAYQYGVHGYDAL